MSEKFQVGEIVDITVKGARVVPSKTDGVLVVEHPIRLPEWQGNWRQVAICIESDSVSVERAAPAEWPPQQGDVWRDRDGGLWFAQDDGASDVTPPVMWMVPSAPRSGGDDGMQAARLFAGHSPLTLEYRRSGGTR